MVRTLDPSMLNIPHPISALAPLAAEAGFEAITPAPEVLDDPAARKEAASVMGGYGLKFGLLPMTADFYFWDLSDKDFDAGIEALKRRADAGASVGIRHAYNHVWSTSPRSFEENYEWHIKRVRTVAETLASFGIRYGLEFLGPHEIRGWQPNVFLHSLPEVLKLADDAGGTAGIAFDCFHWYTSGAAESDLSLMEENISRLVAVHLNDAVTGVAIEDQRDMQRRLPMETGVIDTPSILRRFMAKGSDALYMIEPFEPWRTRFHAMSAEEAVKTAAEVMGRLF